MSFHIRDHYKGKLEQQYRSAWETMDKLVPPSKEVLRQREDELRQAYANFDKEWDSLLSPGKGDYPSMWEQLVNEG